MEKLDEYLWSSHKAYVSKAKKWEWLYKQFVLNMFTVDKNNQIQIYKNYMRQEDDKDLLRVINRQYKPSILGSRKFISRIKDLFFEKKSDKEVPRSKELAPTCEAIIETVSHLYGERPEIVIRLRRGTVNEARDVAIFLIRMLRAEPLQQISETFNLSSYSSVSTVILRIKSKMKSDKKFRKHVENIKSKILKGQRQT